jgi:hypothetical protein
MTLSFSKQGAGSFGRILITMFKKISNHVLNFVQQVENNIVMGDQNHEVVPL